MNLPDNGFNMLSTSKARPDIPNAKTPIRIKNSASSKRFLNMRRSSISIEPKERAAPIILFRYALLVDSTTSPLPVTIVEMPAKRNTAQNIYPNIRICLKISDIMREAKTTIQFSVKAEATPPFGQAQCCSTSGGRCLIP